MSFGRQRERQVGMLVSWAEVPRSRLHVYYGKLKAVLIAADFDASVETHEGICGVSWPTVIAARQLYAADRISCRHRQRARPGMALLYGLSLRGFLRPSERGGVQDHSWSSRARSRLPLEVHDQVFTWALERLPRSRRHAPGLVARPEQRKCYLIHAAGSNLGLLMRLLTGAGTSLHCDGLSSDPCALATGWRPHRRDIRCRRQSVHRIRRHDQTNPTRVNTRFLKRPAKWFEISPGEGGVTGGSG
jgi:hypothetical protein